MSLLPEPRYPTVTEVVSAARALAAQRPGPCTLREVGLSRAGRPLHLLSVGRARRAVLVVAGAHANEPTGGPALLALAERVLHERALRTDTSWHFLLCADPDGASLHVTPAPRSLFDHHLGFFRPAGPEQPEWPPAVLPPDRLPPETRALTRVIDELRPYLRATLHGTELGGSRVPRPAPAAAMRWLAGRLLRDTRDVERVLSEVLPRLDGADGPVLRATHWALELVPGLAANWTRTAPVDDTRAYIGSVDAFARLLPLRAAAMLLRVLRETDDRAARSGPLGAVGAPGRAPVPHGRRGGPARARPGGVRAATRVPGRAPVSRPGRTPPPSAPSARTRCRTAVGTRPDGRSTGRSPGR